MGLMENAQASKSAEQLFNLMTETALEKRFFERMIELCKEALEKDNPPKPVEDKIKPLTEQGAIIFERTEMPFGKYKGQTIGIVPTDYLCMFVDDDSFKTKLKRYIKSDRFKRRQE